jgi:hypothetical protein
MRLTVLLGVASLSMAGCGSSSKSLPAPTTPTAVTWTLSGTVTSNTGAPIAGAELTILDGPDAMTGAVTGTSGQFAMFGLRQAGFTVRATAKGYQSLSKGVSLMANTALDFQLPRLPVANLVVEGELIFDAANQDESRGLHGTALNRGDGCAGSISGTTTLSSKSDANVKVSFPWSLSAATILRPGERAQYSMCCMTVQQLQQFGPEGTYNTQFSFVTVACP